MDDKQVKITLLPKGVAWSLIIIGLLLMVLGVVLGVGVETPLYRIECNPENATIQSIGFKQTCEYEWKGAGNLTKDVAFCFDTRLTSGQVLYYHPNGVMDISGQFKYKSFPIVNGDCYYLQNVKWTPGEVKKIDLIYRPVNPDKPKWDTYFGNITTGVVDLKLDPFFNSTRYEIGTTRGTDYNWVSPNTYNVDILNNTCNVNPTNLSTRELPRRFVDLLPEYQGYVRENSATTAFPDELFVQRTSGADQRGYLFYNLTNASKYDILANITSLILYYFQTTSGSDALTVGVYYCNDTNGFNKATLTWNNQATEVTGCEAGSYVNLTIPTSSSTSHVADFSAKVVEYGYLPFVIKLQGITGVAGNAYVHLSGNTARYNQTVLYNTLSSCTMFSKQINLSVNVNHVGIIPDFYGDAGINISFTGSLADGQLINFSQQNYSIASGMLHYYKLDETAGTVVIGYGSNRSNAVKTGTPTQGKPGILNYSYNSWSASNYIVTPFKSPYNADFTWNVWINWTNSSADEMVILGSDPSSGTRTYNIYIFNRTINVGCQAYNCGYARYNNTFTSTLTPNSWVMLTARYTASQKRWELFVDGMNSNETGIGLNLIPVLTDTIYIGKRNYNTAEAPFNSNIDEVMFWNRVISDSEITALWANGSALDPREITFTPSTPATSNTKLIYRLLLYNDNTTINSMTLDLSPQMTTFTARAFQFISNSTLNYSILMRGNANYTFNSTAQQYTNTVIGGTYNVTYSSGGHFNCTFNNVDLLTGTTIPTCEFANTILRVNATNNVTLAKIQNFNVTVTYNANGYTASQAVTDYDANFTIINGSAYTVAVSSSGYTSQSQALTWTGGSNDTIFYLQPCDVIVINIRNEDTGALINGSNTTVLLTKLATQFSYTTANGTLIIDKPPAGLYIVTVSNSEGNFTTRYYNLTVTDVCGVNTLNFYLPTGTTAVTFTAFQTVDNRPVVLSNVSMLLYGFANSTYALLESRITDVSGRAVFNIRQNVPYTLILSKPGYNTVSYDFNPIQFTAYNIPMTPTDDIVADNDTVIYISPYRLWINELNNLTFAIGSPNRLLTTYNYSLTGNCVLNISGSGNTSGGEIFYIPVTPNLSCVAGDLLTLNYDYFLSTNNSRSLTAQLGLDRKTGNFTIIQNLDNTYGMTVLERTMIVTIVVLVFAGLGAFFGGDIVGLALGLFILAYFNIFTSFGTVWANVITIFVGILLLITRSVNR